MSVSSGKKFENNIKASVPDNVLYYRLKDSAQSFEKTARFTLKNPCDIFLFDTPLLLPIELKTTNKKYFTVELEKNDTNKMIHYHQWKGLLDFSEYTGCVSGFILNYRINEDTDDYNEVTYFIHIQDFVRMMKEVNKKSFSVIDLLNYSPIKIDSIKRRTNFKYDLDSFLKVIHEQYENTK